MTAERKGMDDLKMFFVCLAVGLVVAAATGALFAYAMTEPIL